MKENGDKQIDDLTRKVIEKASLESPSSDFTAQILAKVIDSKQSDITIFRPLISKTSWLVIFVGFTALVVYAIIGMQPQTPNGLGILDFSTLLNNKISGIISRLIFSKTVKYALLSLSIMLLIQVYFFKSYLDKRFEV